MDPTAVFRVFTTFSCNFPTVIFVIVTLEVRIDLLLSDFFRTSGSKSQVFTFQIDSPHIDYDIFLLNKGDPDF